MSAHNQLLSRLSIFPLARSDSYAMGKNASAAESSKRKKTAGKKPPVQKPTLEANWSKSLVTLEQLNGMVEEGILPPQSEIKWRVPGEETRPKPKKGEVIVFADHVTPAGPCRLRQDGPCHVRSPDIG